LDRNRLGHRLDDKQLRGRNGRAACRTGSGSSLGHGRQGRLLTSDPGAKSTPAIDELRAESRHRLASRPEFAVIDVPSALGLHPSGVQDAPDALRGAGLHRLLKPTEVIRVDVPPYSRTRTVDPPYHGIHAATVATHGNGFGLFLRIPRRSHFATSCHRLQPRGSIKAPYEVVCVGRHCVEELAARGELADEVGEFAIVAVAAGAGPCGARRRLPTRRWCDALSSPGRRRAHRQLRSNGPRRRPPD
jgi:hypothetical protein